MKQLGKEKCLFLIFNRYKLLFIAALILIINFACSNKKDVEIMANPFLEKYNTPHNATPFNLLKPEHFKPAFDSVFAETKSKVDKIITNHEAPSFENTVVALERANNKLNHLAATLFNLNLAETAEELQKVTREMSPALADFGNDILLNEDLFKKIKSVYENTDKDSLDIEDLKLLEKTFKDFERSGANLTGEQKERYREISKELAQITVQFDENILAETNAFILHIADKEDLSGLPEDVVFAAEEEAKSRDLEGWVFTLQFPSYVPFLKYANNRELRKKLALAYNTRALKDNEHDNRAIAKRIIQLRIEKSNLLGHNTYSDFILENRMAKTTDRVQTFLNDLLIASLPAAKKEYKEVQDFASSLGADFTIEGYDWAYYSEKLKKQKFDIDDEMTRPYFQLEKVEQGVFGLANTLFGLTLKENLSIPVYHPDVKTYEVFDKNNKFLAVLYMDYFPRTGKKGGAWMTEFQQQHITDNGLEHRPHVSLVFNFTKPTTKKPSLLSFTEVTTLLHEFGHGLHGMLSQCKYEELAGTNVYRDFVELPSQILENWAEEKEWLDKVAMHFETGDKIPDSLVQKIIDSKNFNSGYFSLRQISFGLLDMKWHTLTEPFQGDVIEFEEEAMAATRLMPKQEGTAMSTAFSHIFSGGYAAGYYSYKWAEVLDADAFAYFKEKGIFNKKIAESFKDNILSKGGTEDPMELYVRFRGKEPSIDPLLERSGLK